MSPFASQIDYETWLKGDDGAWGTLNVDPNVPGSYGAVHNGTASDDKAPIFSSPDSWEYKQWVAACGSAPPLQLANPDYTAADAQHPFLAVQNPDGTVSLPSFYRSSGSAPVAVDTDGDGIADAIWIDIGLPVRAMPDGRLVKPLVAVKISDLDGRLNVNAHGNYAQADATGAYYSAVDPTAAYFKSWGTSGPTFYLWNSSTQGVANPILPRGFGYGPAEVNLMPLFGAANYTGYNALLQSRYGTSGFPGSANTADDPLHLNKWFDYLMTGYWDATGGGAGVYGSPPNRLGGGAIGVDPAGRALYLRMGGADPIASGNNERLNDPYKMNLSKPAPWNTPFTPSELEAILRQNDYDAARLPTRLKAIFDAAGHRSDVTTASWHVPAPTFFIPKHLSSVPEVGTPASARFSATWPPGGSADVKRGSARLFRDGASRTCYREVLRQDMQRDSVPKR